MIKNFLKVMVVTVSIMPHSSCAMEEKSAATSWRFLSFITSSAWWGRTRNSADKPLSTPTENPDEWVSIDSSPVVATKTPELVACILDGRVPHESPQEDIRSQEDAEDAEFEEIKASIIPADAVFLPSLVKMYERARRPQNDGESRRSRKNKSSPTVSPKLYDPLCPKDADLSMQNGASRKNAKNQKRKHKKSGK